MSNGGKRNYFKGDQWFQAKVNARVREALAQKEAQFEIDHNHDTDEELLEYVCAFAKKLGRTPNASEIIGGQYIYRRFGRWENVVGRARLPVPWKAPAPTNRLIFKEEFKRQAALFQQERRDSKEERKSKIRKLLALRWKHRKHGKNGIRHGDRNTAGIQMSNWQSICGSVP